MSKIVDSFNDIFNSSNLDENYRKLLSYMNNILTPTKIKGGLSLQRPQRSEYSRRVFANQIEIQK